MFSVGQTVTFHIDDCSKLELLNGQPCTILEFPEPDYPPEDDSLYPVIVSFPTAPWVGPTWAYVGELRAA